MTRRTTVDVATRTVIAAVCTAAAWSLQAVAEDIPGARPGDEAMTCAQIAAELAPYAQQMTGTMSPLAQTQQELMQRMNQRQAEATTAAAALTAGATASTADPTGLASKNFGQAEAAIQKQMWDRAAAEDKPLQDQYNQQVGAVAAQGQQLQQNARIQRLMQLVQQKNCQ
jgi:hypothetical protein